MTTPRRADERMDAVISILLATGVGLAALVVLIGGALYLARHGGEMPQYGVFQGEPSDLRTIPGVMGAALSLSGRGIIQLGILLLIATPIARVVFSVAAFAAQRDRLYVVVTLIVLAILVVNLLGVK